MSRPATRRPLRMEHGSGCGRLPEFRCHDVYDPAIGPSIGVVTGICGSGALMDRRNGYPGFPGGNVLRNVSRGSSSLTGGRGPHIHAVRIGLRVFIHPISALLIFAGAWLLFLVVLDPWFMNWGSTPEERAMVLPRQCAVPTGELLHASDHHRRAAIGGLALADGDQSGSAGFLSNDYLENLAGADIHNADSLRPEWQLRAIGDKVPMAGSAERAMVGDYTLLNVRILYPGRIIGHPRSLRTPTPRRGVDAAAATRVPEHPRARGCRLVDLGSHAFCYGAAPAPGHQGARGGPTVRATGAAGGSARRLGACYAGSARAIRGAAPLAAVARAARLRSPAAALANWRSEQCHGRLPGGRHHRRWISRLRPGSVLRRMYLSGRLWPWCCCWRLTPMPHSGWSSWLFLAGAVPGILNVSPARAFPTFAPSTVHQRAQAS